MSCTIVIEGYVPCDEEWDKKKKAWIALKEAGLDITEELEEFFDYQNPTEIDGMKVDIDYEGDPNYKGGALIEVAKLPKNIKYIRVENQC